MARRSTYDYRKNRRKRSRNRKNRVVVQNSIIKKSWNGRISIRSNFNRIGLAFDPNEAVRKTDRAEEAEPLADPEIVRGLKNIKNLKKMREKFISEDDRIFCIYLMELYGEDYGAMYRDPRNVYQLTPTQIKRLISAFRKSKYYAQYLRDKSENSFNVLELYE